MRIKVDEFVKALRPEHPDALTPAQLQPFVLYLLVEVEREQEMLLEAKGIANSEQYATVESIQRDVDRFRDRLTAYADYLSEAITERQGNNALEGQPVSLPLFRGYYSEGFRKGVLLPGGFKQSPLCFGGPESCEKSTPDIATIAIIRNQLDEFHVADEFATQQLFEDLEKSAKDTICTVAAGACAVHEIYKAVADDDDDEIPAWKWAAAGAAGVLGLFVLVKILK